MTIMKAAGSLLTGLGCPVTVAGAAAAVLPLIEEPHLQQALRSLETPSGQQAMDTLKKAAVCALQHKWVVLGAGAALLLLGVLLLWGHGRRMRARARQERQYRRESYRAEEAMRFQRPQRPWASPYEQPAEEAFAYQQPHDDRYVPPVQPWAVEDRPEEWQAPERMASPYARPLADEPSPVEDLQLWANQTPGFQQPAPRPKSQPYWMTMEQEERASKREFPAFQAKPVHQDAVEPQVRWSSRTVMPSQEPLFQPVTENTVQESAPAPVQPTPAPAIAPAVETADAAPAYATAAPMTEVDPYAGQYEPNEPPEENAPTSVSSRIRSTMGKHRM